MAFAVPQVEARSTAKGNSVSNAQLWEGQPRRNRRWNNRRVRTVTRTRITRVGRYTYRETYRITYLPNGRTRTQIISRVRIGGRRY
jgi:hypothetical protein